MSDIQGYSCYAVILLLYYATDLYVIVINRLRGLYWFYKREARGRVAPEAERLLNQYRPTAPVNKYFLDHTVT